MAERLVEREKPELSELIRRAVGGAEAGYRARRNRVDAGHAMANEWDEVLTQRDQLAERAGKAKVDWQAACKALVADNKHRRLMPADDFWTAADQLKKLGESAAFQAIQAVLEELPQRNGWKTQISDFVDSNSGYKGEGTLAKIRAGAIAPVDPEEFIKIESSAGQIGRNYDISKSYGRVWLNGVDRINDQLSTEGQSLPIELSGRIKSDAQRKYLAERDRLYKEEIDRNIPSWEKLGRDLTERERALNERCEKLTERSKAEADPLLDFEPHNFQPSGILYESLQDVLKRRDAWKQELASQSRVSQLSQEIATMGVPGIFASREKRAKYEGLQAELLQTRSEYVAVPARILSFETALSDLEKKLNGTR